MQGRGVPNPPRCDASTVPEMRRWRRCTALVKGVSEKIPARHRLNACVLTRMLTVRVPRVIGTREILLSYFRPRAFDAAEIMALLLRQGFLRRGGLRSGWPAAAGDRRDVHAHHHLQRRLAGSVGRDADGRAGPAGLSLGGGREGNGQPVQRVRCRRRRALEPLVAAIHAHDVERGLAVDDQGAGDASTRRRRPATKAARDRRPRPAGSSPRPARGRGPPAGWRRRSPGPGRRGRSPPAPSCQRRQQLVLDAPDGARRACATFPRPWRRGSGWGSRRGESASRGGRHK